jgi:hypothetical protein
MKSIYIVQFWNTKPGHECKKYEITIKTNGKDKDERVKAVWQKMYKDQNVQF